MKEKRYYIAYGSNLNVGQMRMRCPHATILGTANLKGWELLFKGSKTGSYLTIEKSEAVQRHPHGEAQDGDGLCLHHA